MRINKDQSGFSYIDVMIAIVIMMVGILAMVGALSANLVRSMESERRVMAKQLALSTIESIISAKEIEREGVVFARVYDIRGRNVKDLNTIPPVINGGN